MDWTKEQPNIMGYYWYWKGDHPFRVPTVVLVDDYGQFYTSGSSNSHQVKAWGGWWMGPLPYPTRPKVPTPLTAQEAAASFASTAYWLENAQDGDGTDIDEQEGPYIDDRDDPERDAENERDMLEFLQATS